MKIKKYFTFLSTLTLLLTFFYTFNINYDLSRKLNVANLGITLIVFILWLVGGYLFLIKDIIKASEREKNGLVLVFVLLGIIFFYYNPLPSPDGYYIDIPRVFYFILTIIIFGLFIALFWREKATALIIATFLPLSIQSYLVNINYNTQYTSYTFYIVTICIAVAYAINYFKNNM